MLNNISINYTIYHQNTKIIRIFEKIYPKMFLNTFKVKMIMNFQFLVYHTIKLFCLI